MSEFAAIAPGADVAALLFNSRWVNHVTGAANRANLDGGQRLSGSRLAYLPLDVLNDSGAAIDVPFPILRLTTPVVTVSDNANAPYNDADFKGATPNADTGAAFVILQGPVGDGKARPAALIGLSWCKVDVASASDTHATTIDGDNTKLQSGKTGVRIVWKESGTGEKWALVLLGGGGSDCLVMVLLTGNVSAASYSSGTLSPSTFTARLWMADGDDWTQSADDTKECTNPYLSAISVASGKGRLAWVTAAGELVVVDCTEFTL